MLALPIEQQVAGADKVRLGVRGELLERGCRGRAPRAQQPVLQPARE